MGKCVGKQHTHQISASNQVDPFLSLFDTDKNTSLRTLRASAMMTTKSIAKCFVPDDYSSNFTQAAVTEPHDHSQSATVTQSNNRWSPIRIACPEQPYEVSY